MTHADTKSDHGVSGIWITLFFIALTVAFVIGIFVERESTPLAWCALGSSALAASWPLVSKVDNLKIGATGVEMSKRVEQASAKANDANANALRALETITRFVFNSMPRPTFLNLLKIDSGRFGPFRADEGFRQQLRYLRDSGYILTNGLNIREIPGEGSELSNYVYCTDLGKEFIAQRQAAEARAQLPGLLDWQIRPQSVGDTRNFP